MNTIVALELGERMAAEGMSRSEIREALVTHGCEYSLAADVATLYSNADEIDSILKALGAGDEQI